MAKAITTKSFGHGLAAVGHQANLLRQLTRCELSAMVAVSGLTGFLFATGHWRLQGLIVLAATWLLAAGSSALNQWQEQDLDARMLRTRQRPLPTGQLSPMMALIIAGSCLSCGLLLLFLLPDGPAALLLGLLAIVWYNGIYTPLKRRTPFAALPGAVCGALPPAIGWVGAGHSLQEPEILILSGTLFLWQIPHTWLLLCHYRQDLQRSGLPDLFQRISTRRLLRLNNVWLAALGLCYLYFPVFGLISSPWLEAIFLGGLFFCGIGMIYETLKAPSRTSPIRLFHLTNLSMALLLLCLISDNLTL